MSSLSIVVVDVTLQYRLQMTLIHDHQMVQAFPPDAPDKSFAMVQNKVAISMRILYFVGGRDFDGAHL